MTGAYGGRQVVVPVSAIVAPRGLRRDRDRVDHFELALGGAHRGGGVALGQLDRVVALADRGDDVLRRHVLAEVHHAVRAAAEQLRVRVDGQLGQRNRLIVGGRLSPGVAVRVGGQHGPHSRRCRAARRARLPADRLGVADQLVAGAVAGDAASGENVRRQVTREEAGRPRVVAGLVAGHVEQRRRRGPADRGHHQVARDRGAARHLDRAHAAVATHPDEVATGAGVEDRGDLDPGPPEVGRPPRHLRRWRSARPRGAPA